MTQTQLLQIRTPEGIVFSLQLAGPMSRALAWLVDLACLLGIAILLGTLTQWLGLISRDFAQAISALLFFVVSVGYGIALEWLWQGQTVGKRLLRLRVMDASGMRLQLSQVVLRNLLRAVDMLPLLYLVGGVACFFSRRSQRLGDFAANTVVVRNAKRVEPDLNALLEGKYNSLREHPHLGARLRQRTSPAEAALALQAILRRDTLEPAARLEVFAEIAEHFRAKVPFPAEITTALADEQYVRNVVDVLYS